MMKKIIEHDEAKQRKIILRDIMAKRNRKNVDLMRKVLDLRKRSRKEVDEIFQKRRKKFTP